MKSLSSYHVLFLCTLSAAKDIKSHFSSRGLWKGCKRSAVNSSDPPDFTPCVPTVAVLIILQIEERAEEWGHGAQPLGREKRGGSGEGDGGGGGL